MAGDAALFLDRDGVINKEHEYVHRKDDFEFIDGVFEACRAAIGLGYRLVIITNQAGIARGLYSETDFHALTEWMLGRFSEQGITIEGVYFCPHHPTAGLGPYLKRCTCRKPAPGLITQAARELGLDLARSVLVGDKISDVEAGQRAGVGTCLLVRSGHPLSDSEARAADAVVTDLRAAIPFLRSRRNGANIDQGQG